ncbi:MAG: hypothetical protein AAFU65_05870 [Pseudomonadota bacterium]
MAGPASEPEPAPRIVADFRGGPRAPEAAADAASRIAAVYGTPAPADVALAARRTGTFTRPDAPQQAVLFTRGGPLAGPSARPSLLAVFEGDKVVAQFVVPDVVYHDVAAATDIDGDALDDVVLVAQAYQMGQTTLRADALSLAGGQRRSVAAFGTVFENTCDVPLGDHAVAATVVAKRPDGTLERQAYRADCASDGAAPESASFEALGAEPLPVTR